MVATLSPPLYSHPFATQLCSSFQPEPGTVSPPCDSGLACHLLWPASCSRRDIVSLGARPPYVHKCMLPAQGTMSFLPLWHGGPACCRVTGWWGAHRSWAVQLSGLRPQTCERAQAASDSPTPTSRTAKPALDSRALKNGSALPPAESGGSSVCPAVISPWCRFHGGKQSIQLPNSETRFLKWCRCFIIVIENQVIFQKKFYSNYISCLK